MLNNIPTFFLFKSTPNEILIPFETDTYKQIIFMTISTNKFSNVFCDPRKHSQGWSAREKVLKSTGLNY